MPLIGKGIGDGNGVNFPLRLLAFIFARFFISLKADLRVLV